MKVTIDIDVDKLHDIRDGVFFQLINGVFDIDNFMKDISRQIREQQEQSE